MKRIHLSALILAGLCAAGVAQAQTSAPVSQEYQYPSARSKDGSQSPPSTLRVTGVPTQGSTPVVIRDSEQSKAEYKRCRDNSDRAAVSADQMQVGVESCLKQLESRREPIQ